MAHTKKNNVVKKDEISKKEEKITHAVGPFFYFQPLSIKTRTKLREIAKFYNNKKNLKLLLIPSNSEYTSNRRNKTIIQNNTRNKKYITGQNNTLISRRQIYWALINYTKLNHIIKVKNDETINLHREYNNFLYENRKTLFDTFRRGQRIYFKYKGCTEYTTVAEAVGMKMAYETGLLQYIKDNIIDINLKMQEQKIVLKQQQKKNYNLMTASNKNQCVLYSKELTPMIKNNGVEKTEKYLTRYRGESCFIYACPTVLHDQSSCTYFTTLGDNKSSKCE